MNTLEVPFEFTSFIERVGKDFSLTQGLGGNCSVKSKTSMLVKASGKRLASINMPDYFHEVALTDEGFEDSIVGQSTRPSIEVFLHADLPGKYVLHLHSLRAIAASMRLGSSTGLVAELGDGLLAFVPYARPGLQLRNEIRQVLRANPRAMAFVLANHGILVSGDSISELEVGLSRLDSLFTEVLGKEGDRSIGPHQTQARLSVEEADAVSWHAHHNWRVAPDHVVFLGKEAPLNFLKELNGSPRVVNLIGGLRPDGSQTVESEQLLAFINIALMLPKRVFSTLSQEESLFLAHWGSEKERQKAARSEN